MEQTQAAGLMILQDGRIVFEDYALGLKPTDRWTSFSVAKSFTSTLLGAASSVLFGDFGSLAGQIPLLLGQLAYSREAEREADDEAIVLLRAAGLSPAVMVTLFERLAGPDGTGRDNAPPIALASHPADAERIARFQQAADAR